MRKFIVMLFGSGVAGIASGCAALAVGAVAAVAALGVYKYVNNDLSRDYQADYDKAWDASVKAAQDLELRDVVSAHDFAKGTIDAKRADNRPVKIAVTKKGRNLVTISVRVGTFESADNRSAAETIHDRIFVNMGGKKEPAGGTP